MHKKIPDFYSKREGGNPGNSGLSLNNRCMYTTPVLFGRTAMLNTMLIIYNTEHKFLPILSDTPSLMLQQSEPWIKSDFLEPFRNKQLIRIKSGFELTSLLNRGVLPLSSVLHMDGT